MASEEILFSNQNIKLAGTLYKPETVAPYPAVVVVHPASEGERTSSFYEHLKSKLPQNGIAVLIFDRRGSGASEGDFETADFEDLASDAISAVEYYSHGPISINPTSVCMEQVKAHGSHRLPQRARQIFRLSLLFLRLAFLLRIR